MKIFQIEADVCYWEATKQFPTLESTVGYFPPSVKFVEAPDHVFEGWGYVNGEFIKPTGPDGWIYDEETGTFYHPDVYAKKDLTYSALAHAGIDSV